MHNNTRYRSTLTIKDQDKQVFEEHRIGETDEEFVFDLVSRST